MDFTNTKCELIRHKANVLKINANLSPLQGAVFGIYESKEAAEKEDISLARVTTGADGVSEGEKTG